MFYDNLNNPNKQRIAAMYNPNPSLRQMEDDALFAKAIEGMNGLQKAEELGILSGMSGNDLEKGRIGMPIGAHANWGGVDYLKTASGWKPAGKFRGHVKSNHDHIHNNEDQDKDHHEMTMDAGKMDEKEWTAKHGANLHSKYKAVHDYLHKPKAEKKEVVKPSTNISDLFDESGNYDGRKAKEQGIELSQNEVATIKQGKYNKHSPNIDLKTVKDNAKKLNDADGVKGDIDAHFIESLHYEMSSLKQMEEQNKLTIDYAIENYSGGKTKKEKSDKLEIRDRLISEAIKTAERIALVKDIDVNAIKQYAKDKTNIPAPAETKDTHENKGDVDATGKGEESKEDHTASIKYFIDKYDKEILSGKLKKEDLIKQIKEQLFDLNKTKPSNRLDNFNKNLAIVNGLKSHFDKHESKKEKPKDDPTTSKIKAIVDKAVTQYNAANHVDKAKLKKLIEDNLKMHENGLKHIDMGADEIMVSAGKEFLKRIGGGASVEPKVEEKPVAVKNWRSFMNHKDTDRLPESIKRMNENEVRSLLTNKESKLNHSMTSSNDKSRLRDEVHELRSVVAAYNEANEHNKSVNYNTDGHSVKDEVRQFKENEKAKWVRVSHVDGKGVTRISGQAVDLHGGDRHKAIEAGKESIKRDQFLESKNLDSKSLNNLSAAEKKKLNLEWINHKYGVAV